MLRPVCTVMFYTCYFAKMLENMFMCHFPFPCTSCFSTWTAVSQV